MHWSRKARLVSLVTCSNEPSKLVLIYLNYHVQKTKFQYFDINIKYSLTNVVPVNTKFCVRLDAYNLSQHHYIKTSKTKTKQIQLEREIFQPKLCFVDVSLLTKINRQRKTLLIIVIMLLVIMIANDNGFVREEQMIKYLVRGCLQETVYVFYFLFFLLAYFKSSYLNSKEYL